MKYILTATVVLVGLSACSPNSATNQDFNREAGSSLDDGTFGAATMNNTLIHAGQANLTINLAKRFAAEVNSTITFPFNSTALDETARATLRQQATWINQFPEVRFKVFGHTDLVGSQAYNRKLGLARAEAALLYLTSQGIDRSRLEAVVSFGRNTATYRHKRSRASEPSYGHRSFWFCERWELIPSERKICGNHLP